MTTIWIYHICHRFPPCMSSIYLSSTYVSKPLGIFMQVHGYGQEMEVVSPSVKEEGGKRGTLRATSIKTSRPVQ